MRAVIVASDAIIREGLRQILASSSLEVVGVAASPQEAAEQVEALAPDVVFVSAGMARERDYALVTSIAQTRPGLAIVLVSLGDDGDVFEDLRHGASACLCGDVSPRSLQLAAQAAGQGYVLANEASVRRALGKAAEQRPAGEASLPCRLTPREIEVLRLVTQGLSNREVAARLTVTVATARTHISNILGKLGVSDRVQAAVWAEEHGLGGMPGRL